MMGDWTVFSNHGHVLVSLASKNDARLRDVAVQVGITERAVQKIVKDLQEAGFIEIRKQGRCNRYRINRRKSLRHSLESQCTVGKLLNLVTSPGPAVRRVVEQADTAWPESGPHPEMEETAVPEPAAKVDEPLSGSQETSAVSTGVPPVESTTEPVRKPEKERTEAKPAKDTDKGPVDVRQQGSLF